MKKLNVFILLLISFSLIRCNIISTQNISNNFKWRNEKFDTVFNINFRYNPVVINNIISNDPVFYNLSDTIHIDAFYRIEELLKKKFKKRNIQFKKKASVTIIIDTLLFKEYAESVDVYSNDASEHIGTSEKDFFTFKIVGTLQFKNKEIPLSAIKKMNTEPRESYLFSGMIAKSGVNANPNKIIENCINKFSYIAYKNLK